MKTVLMIATLVALSLAACKEQTTQRVVQVAPIEQPAVVKAAPAFPKIVLSGAMQDMYDTTIADCNKLGDQAKACMVQAFKDQEQANALEDAAIRRGEGGPYVQTWLDDYRKHTEGEPGQLSAYNQCRSSAQAEPARLLLCAVAELDWIYKHRERLAEYQDAAAKALSKIPTKHYNVQGD